MKVSIVKCSSYEQYKVDKSLKESLDLIGFDIKKYKKVLLKPNLLMAAKPDKAITTHPSILIALLKILKDSKVYIGDSPGSPNYDDILRRTGMKKIAEEYDAEIINFSIQGMIRFENQNNQFLKKIELPKIIEDVDLIINLPKMKTHVLTRYTGAVKNLFGFIAGGKKGKFHVDFKKEEDFSQMLVELHDFIKPKLNIMDGVIGMEGYGPSGGKPKNTGLILASENAIALDKTANDIMCYKDGSVTTTRIALEKKPLEIEKVGLADVKVFYKKPMRNLNNIVALFASGIFKIKVNITKDCKRCLECYKKCPVKAIKKTKPLLKINQKECIQCLCCHEICPYKAVRIEHNFIFRIAKAVKKLFF